MFEIPLAYNPIDAEGLGQVLKRYEGKDHNLIIRDFEEALQEYLGDCQVVALNSGTAAIHLALLTLGVGPGDYVLVSTFTYVASINPIAYVGASPVFIDAEPATGNMDPEVLQDAIDELILQGIKPKAILVVHSYGIPADMAKIREISKDHEIPVIEDAAESFGSFVGEVHTGMMGEMGILSFNNNKIISTFGGGALIVRDPAQLEHVRRLASQARENKPYYEHLEVGFSYRIGPLNAAHGLAELSNFDSRLNSKLSIFQEFKAKLTDFDVRFIEAHRGDRSNHWVAVAVFGGNVNIQLVRDFMHKKGIEVRNLWNPMHLQPVFAANYSFVNGTSERMFHNGLCFPTGLAKTHDGEKIITELISILT